MISNKERAKQLVEAFLLYEGEDTEWMIQCLTLEFDTIEKIAYARVQNAALDALTAETERLGLYGRDPKN